MEFSDLGSLFLQHEVRLVEFPIDAANNRYTFTPCEELGFDAAGRLIATMAQTS